MLDAVKAREISQTNFNVLVDFVAQNLPKILSIIDNNIMIAANKALYETTIEYDKVYNEIKILADSANLENFTNYNSFYREFDKQIESHYESKGFKLNKDNNKISW